MDAVKDEAKTAASRTERPLMSKIKAWLTTKKVLEPTN